VNNEVINKVQNVVTHSGGNRCTGGLTATPCKELVEWYQTEFKGSANGFLGGISTVTFDGVVQGWAVDSANPTAKVNVVFYINDTGVGIGTSIGSQTANLDGVVPVSSPAYQHSFSFTLPTQYKNGTTHTIYVYANSASPANVLPAASKTFAAFAPTVAGMNYYNNTVKPALNVCASCHFVDYGEQYRALAFPSPREGGTATNNSLIARPGGLTGHGGGNICGGINGTPCNLFQQWWALEFGP
jgi:cytochrome c553